MLTESILMKHSDTVLEVDDLRVDFKSDGTWKQVVRGVSFELKKEEILAIVGESGSGKSVSCMSLTKLLPEHISRISGGKVLFRDNDKLAEPMSMSSKQLQRFRGSKIAYIFQEPTVSLNPVIRVGKQIAEAIKLHRPSIKNTKSEVISLLDQVGIPQPEMRYKSYPHEMSGGMQQRVMIAMALACEPDILIADEPTTALDVTIQAQILDLLCSLRQKRGMSIILITHNLGIVSEIADRVLVMYDGTTMESAPTKQLISGPKHPYTQALLKAVPRMGQKLEPFDSIPGMDPAAYSSGNTFDWIKVSESHWVREHVTKEKQQVCGHITQIS